MLALNMPLVAAVDDTGLLPIPWFTDLTAVICSPMMLARARVKRQSTVHAGFEFEARLASTPRRKIPSVSVETVPLPSPPWFCPNAMLAVCCQPETVRPLEGATGATGVGAVRTGAAVLVVLKI